MGKGRRCHVDASVEYSAPNRGNGIFEESRGAAQRKVGHNA
ncbi:uncharacterized protein G2W53_036181 [Senna tora]|uniref:Uncharacterized protein n=1 Tax=Senna tora TaxID=362788 RepID=A0A834SS44_9FABA|nr:uncharacterized protein G2W53_036181 [Senna tora]